MKQPTLLLCRPEKQSQLFQSAVEERLGQSVATLISPAFDIEPLYPNVPENEPDHLVFTSKNGVDAAIRLKIKAGNAAYCVGPATTQHAKENGFRAIDGGGDVDSLLQHIRTTTRERSFLHVSGQHVTGDVVGQLQGWGYYANRLIAYRQVRLKTKQEFSDCLAGSSYKVLPLFSPRSAGIMSGVLVGENTHVIAMSQSIAMAAQGHAAKSVIVATAPNIEAMLDATCEKLTL